jgi:predicted heme/steroid binding protein
MKQFSKDELAKNNGKNGTPVFIAYNGKVYDVTKSSRWEDGEHENMHDAGKDLTNDLESMSPHGADVMERFPVIGTLTES